MSSDLFFYTSSDDKEEFNSELAMFTEVCQAAYEASKPKVQRTQVERDRYGAHDRLVMAYFYEHPQYDKATFRERFRMSRKLFTKIVREVTDASHFFQQRDYCTGQRGISSLMKCTFVIRQMAYRFVHDSLDEYLQMGATTARKSLQIFCKVVMNLYGEEFLRKPTYTDMEKLYSYHDEKHEFSEISRVDCERKIGVYDEYVSRCEKGVVNNKERMICRSLSEKVMRVEHENDHIIHRKLRRSVTEKKIRVEDELSSDEFRRTVEDFIARQQRSLRNEELPACLP
nr:protein ALP1-like [Tanacetum cinerariifolium]